MRVDSPDDDITQESVVDVLESLDPSFRRGFVRTSAVRALRVLPERAAGLPEVRQARELLGAPA